ncbi:hypothetical protein IFM89_035427 [Coptis chinensis]|uniref:Pentatricopeptide repeat-containing protein n=1 Tax=Coptis chinensis TaxID=261450 RepID=A0A835HJ98_9MAGN|nr:hypothetical protein IFM89_035427 [Coptis chinensis]
MELQNIKLFVFRYRLLIDARGQANDIEGMEKCVETMKEDGFEPDIQTQGLLVRHYVTGGFTKKAEAILKEMEGANLKQNCWACEFYSPLSGTSVRMMRSVEFGRFVIQILTWRSVWLLLKLGVRLGKLKKQRQSLIE